MKAAIAELEQRLAAHDAQRDRIVAALNAVRALDGDAPVTSGRGETTVLKVVRAPKQQGHGGSRSKVSPETWARARVVAAKDGLRAAATAAGASYSVVWARAKGEGWKTAPSPRGPQHAKPATATAPTKRRVLGSECPRCHLVSPENPCSACGKEKRAA